ncbi:bifunctional metallophosphatase/5'-nucleotidase [Clostridium folliculivorans]|uniref:Metallophosphoesterase YunD n=1 Tax=Clostridium folliculivorans TaxID=2886038 RepID=A0A9W5Y691_9CLOT|nr:bifunctional UDP-sugar hydrolase/5'-nucleotidase [Clostridium folliculivorans]GKU27519.1 putative metallophosphoesterase YunD [Clostridium folliculivorans]GKU32368.1 putative metallophosphoesterase YunD [Clostridium folliculivorans]
MRLNILHTNDIHSNFENFSKISTKIKELKDENTIVLDAGDFADFKRMELQGTNGLAALELLESAGYDAIAVGNNETFNGVETLINMASNSKIPFLSSNLFDLELNSIQGVRRSFILNKNGLRILLIGTSPDIGPFNELGGYKLKNHVEVIKEEIAINDGKYDLCVVLSHLGMKKDKEIAEKVDMVDVIIGGHFHILMERPEVVNGTIIFTSGCYGENLGVLKLEVNNTKVDMIEGRNINISDCKECDDIIKVLKINKEKAIDKLSEPLYELDRDLWHDVVEENPITNLLADALVDVLKCDIGLINSGVINGGIRKGKVTLKKLLEICPSPLNPTYFEIEGKYLREALQNSLDTDYCYANGMGPGFRGKYVGRLHVSNAIIEHNCRNIINIFINGEKLDDDKLYTVASCDYLQRGTGYSSLSNNRNEKYNHGYLRETLREYIEKKEFVERAFVDRWILA